MQRRVPNDVRSFLGAAVEKAAVYLQCLLAISKVYVSTTMHQPQRTERPVLANGFQHAVAIPETEKWGNLHFQQHCSNHNAQNAVYFTKASEYARRSPPCERSENKTG